ncbi:MAG: hypothetical protein H0T89_04180 [Deltaproteobacteria bacterium]|nr:hypothetical protein [Deltaproteobacteria bacterium]MDQ3297244.1 hypothetical protein [Myxococcota bacterium]
MTQVAFASNGAATHRSTITPLRVPAPFPTTAALALEQASFDELETTFVRGSMPDLGALVGWEFRGINRMPLNRLPIAQLLGIKKFVKGFFKAEDGRVMGYNCPVARNVLDGRWHTKPSDTAPKRFGFYEVAPVDATRRDNAYLHAVLLDYGRGGNKLWDPTRGLRDYLIQVDADNLDLFLGKAYYAIGPARVQSNFFILERWRRGLTDYAQR